MGLFSSFLTAVFGKPLTWQFENEVLKISCSGDMKNYSYEENAPWHEKSDASTLNSTKVIRLNGFWQRRKFKKKFNLYWKRKFSSNKKIGHFQKEQDQFFYVKELELSNGLLYVKILKEKGELAMKVSKTAYDDAFRTLLNDCSELIIPVVNEVFGEHYTGKEKIIFGGNEHFLSQEEDKVKKIITDSGFVIIGSDGVQKRYHIECQSTADNSMLVRIFEYDAQIALDSGNIDDDSVLTVTFPNSAVIFLRHSGKTPNEMRIRIITPGGMTEYLVPVVKVQKYNLEEIFSKRLLFFIPFYIFNHEKYFPEYESNEVNLQKLCEEYSYIRLKLDDLQKAEEISEFTKSAVCTMTNHVLALIAQNYHRVEKGVKDVMRGKIIEYEAKTIRNKAIAEGKAEGRAEGRAEGIAEMKAQIEERAKDMLRDKMTLPLVEKYTHLPMPRIEELARGLGLL